MKTYNDICISARNVLRQYGIEGSALEARLLTAAAAGKTVEQLLRDGQLYANPQVEKTTVEYLARRLRGEPVAYITGTWEFYGLEMEVSPSVLIPRMDTEVLIDAAKELLLGQNMNARILDLCCGSGCIACALANELPASRLVAIDLSAAALEVCRKNVEKHNLTSRVSCRQADALVAPPMGIGSFDMIVSNPPYIASAEIQTLDGSVRNYEPFWALDGGEDGLKFYRAIVKYWKTLLSPGGYMLFEVGEGQADAVKEMLLSGGFDSAETKKDTLGTQRVVIGKMY